MEIALLHKHYDEAHLESVKTEMLKLGAPTIKAVWMEVWGVWAALEGCHRIRAARALGLTPVILPVEYSDEIMAREIVDYEDDSTIADLANRAVDADVVEFDS